jgi:ABC-type transport system involved in multi-copper enzyme maturation permease subunit
MATTVVLFFLPVVALLLGASGFASEFADGAWAYLFSRPVKKWQVWMAKYLSLLTILYAVILLFALLTRLHPVLKSALATFNFPWVDERISFEILAYFVPVLLFTTAFSFSILSEKGYIVVFLTALAWIVIEVVVTRAGLLLFYGGLPYSLFFLISLISILFTLSMALASLITLGRSDFSQPKRRGWAFTKYGTAFILASVALVTLVALGTGRLRRERYIYDIAARSDAFYFATERGFFRFDLARGRTEKIAKQASFWGHVSLGGDKVVFVVYHYSGKRRAFAEMRTMNSDGTMEKPLVATWDKESPLYEAFIHPLAVSPRGDKVAFIASYGRRRAERLWVINSDGSGLKGYDTEIPDVEYYLNLGFGSSGRSLLVVCTSKLKPGSKDQRVGAMLLRVNLESGQVETLADGIRKPYTAAQREGLTSGAGLIAYIQYDETVSREVLTVLDTGTNEKQAVYSEDSVIAFRWNKSGDKLAFLTKKSILGVYSPTEGAIIRTKALAGYDLRWPSQALEWTVEGQLVLRRIAKWEASSICLLDANLIERKAIRLPFDTPYAARLRSAGQYAIVEDTERRQIWGVDLGTEKWHRIY